MRNTGRILGITNWGYILSVALGNFEKSEVCDGCISEKIQLCLLYDYTGPWCTHTAIVPYNLYMTQAPSWSVVQEGQKSPVSEQMKFVFFTINEQSNAYLGLFHHSPPPC